MMNSPHIQQTELDCPQDDCDGQLLEGHYEKFCGSCYIVVGSGESNFSPFADRVNKLWDEREPYRTGEKTGRPYVFGSYTRR